MDNHNFTLKFDLPNTDDDPDQFIDALHDCGCDDALVGVGKLGRIALSFSRFSDSKSAAIESAKSDVLKAIPGARLTECD